MRKTITVAVAVLMMLSATGCYGNAATDGTTRSRGLSGQNATADGTTRYGAGAYGGAYSGLYSDGTGDGFLDGNTRRDGANHGTTNHSGITRGRTHTRRNATNHGTTTHHRRDGANYRSYKSVPPTVGGLDYMR